MLRCPLCGDEIEKGYIQTGERMAWVKQKHKVSLLPKEGEVLLGNNVFTALIFDAFICRKCKKIILDYSNADYQEG